MDEGRGNLNLKKGEIADVEKAVQERFESYTKSFSRRHPGWSEEQAKSAAASLAVLNRKERRKILGHRSPKRGLPLLMKVPKGK